MEDIYGLNPLLSCPEDVVTVGNSSVSATTAVAAAATTTTSGLQLLAGPVASNYLQLEAPKQDVTGSDMPDRLIKTQIANHPLYPDLVSAYIECQKVGAPSELVSLLEEIGQECHPMNARREIGDGPELDDFMFGGKVERLKEKDDILVTVTSTRRQESYCEVLHRYKEELSRPFNEATLFLGNIQSQLSNLCKGILTKSSDNNRSVLSDKAPGTSEEDISCGEIEAVKGHESSGTRLADQTLKEMLLRKYSGHFNSLRQEFLKKKKNGKLPKDARMALMHWWNTHHRWPYPTEEEKVKLSSITGLDQKQINNWFINQRKRHWKPSDQDTRFAVMEGVSGRGIGGPLFF